MEQTRKQLKISSFLVLLFAGLSLLNLISELAFGEINNAAMPEGAPENILLITKIILISLSVIFLLPQIYVGVKGFMEAKNPTFARAHIVWAKILFVLSVIAMITPLVEIFKWNSVFANVSEFFSILVEALVFFEYIKYATAFSKGN